MAVMIQRKKQGYIIFTFVKICKEVLELLHLCMMILLTG